MAVHFCQTVYCQTEEDFKNLASMEVATATLVFIEETGQLIKNRFGPRISFVREVTIEPEKDLQPIMKAVSGLDME